MSKHHNEHHNEQRNNVQETSVAVLDQANEGKETSGALTTFSMDDLFAYAGQGTQDNVSVDDVIIPRLAIVQSMKQLAALPGSKAGDLFNSLTQEIYDGPKGVVVVPVAYSHYLAEWNQKPAYVIARHPMDSAIRQSGKRISGISIDGKKQEFHTDSKGKGNWIDVDGEDREIQETMLFHVLHLSYNGDVRRATINMKSTALKVGSAWNSLIGEQRAENSAGKRFVLPSYGQVWLMATKGEKNKDDQDYFNFFPKFLAPVNDRDVLNAAIAYYGEIKKGEVKVDEGGSDSSDGEGSGSAEKGDIPF